MGKVMEQLRPDQIASITSLCRAGKSNKEIACLTSLSLRSVQRWTKKFRDGGAVDPPLQGKSTGRPRKITTGTLKVLRKQVDADPCLRAPQLKEKNPVLLGNVSVRTVQRRLSDNLKISRCFAGRKPMITLRQRANRVSFCHKYLQWDADKWQKVLWSDEAVFTVTRIHDGKVCRRPGNVLCDPKFTQGTVRHPDSLMVWGAFGGHGVGCLIALPKNVKMNADRNLEVISENLEECFERCKSEVFMQDSAPHHTSKLISDWFEFVGVDYIKDWPGNSPDLNPIEIIWSLMKQKLRERDTSSLPKLEAAIKDIWYNLNPQWLQKLAESVPDRLQECIEKEGCLTKYYRVGTARVQERLGPDAAPSQSTSTATKDDRSATESKLAKKRTGKKNEAAQGRQKMENKVGVPGGLETKVCGLHFTADDVLWEVSHCDEKSGRTVTAPLANPRLRQGAVPSLMPPDCPPPCLLTAPNSSYSAGRGGGGGRGRSSLPSVSEVPKSELSGVDSVFVWEGPDIRPTQGRETKVPSTIGIDRSKKIGELKASAPLPSTSKTRGSTRKKNKLEREEVEDEEEEEKDTKKLKLEEEDWKEEETDPLELEHFQEIKIEEEDPLSDPYLLDEGASDDGLADIIASVKQEYTSWTDKSNQDNQKVVVAEEDFSQKKITSKQSETKTGIVGEELYTLADKSPEDLTRTTKSVPFKWKDETPQGKSSQEERTAKRRRKVLKENSESDTEFSQHFTKDVYDVFGMHVAKTLRDINNIEVFNRVKIKINDILLDALAGDFSSPGFKIKPSVGTQFPPVGEEVSNTTPPGQSFGRKALSEKNFSAPRKGTHKKAVLVVSPGLDKTQKSSVDHSSSIPQQSRIPVTSHSINQPTTLPVHSSLPETTYTTSVHPLVCTSQHSSIPTTSHVLGQPVTVPVTFIVPGKTQAKTVDPHGTTSNLNRMTETTQCANMIAVLPAASFGLAITPTRSGSIPQSSGVPETTQRSTDATQTSTVDPSGSISQQSEIPVTTQTIPHLHPISSSQSSGVPETTHRSTDATQTSSVDPSGSISQHSETPVPTQTIPNLPHVPGKRKKNLAARNPLES
ncbi:uncharacterized protein LOC135198676 isoform X3 [Macrobrachium nipponense]|uniref:uncharacterized protein LOC135198676 isoform X3 n=1 Tax=Macrobrachium nipponense TaxID=159736 RepID=UPI0030C7A5F7